MTGLKVFRILRWAGLAAAFPLLWACAARTLEEPMLKPDQTYAKTFQQTVNRDIDLLFLVDDSTSMRLSQQNLERNFPAFMTALRMIPGGLPNVHIAVISSDMGAHDDIGQCVGTGKAGIFQTMQRGSTCAGTSLMGNYISDVGGVRNYTGMLEDVFSCIAALGEGGCGFEQQFAAVTRALGADGAPPPAENQGFLRPDAYLGIILITNEDDCSSAVGPNFYEGTSNSNLASMLGPPQSYRCNEFGHLCDGAAPARMAPNGMVTDTVMYQSCTSNEGGYLKSVGETVAQVRSLKGDPATQIIVASIQGQAAPYAVHWKAATNGEASPWPEVTHSCMAPDTSYADPGVRLAEFVQAFGGNGLIQSICDDSFAPALTRIAELIGMTIQPPCIQGTIAKKPGTGEDDCSVVSHTRSSTGSVADATLMPCSMTGNMGPCWELVNGTGNCANGRIMNVMPDMSNTNPSSVSATVNCALCTPGITEPARMCP
jgi:hypothetical protein